LLLGFGVIAQPDRLSDNPDVKRFMLCIHAVLLALSSVMMGVAEPSSLFSKDDIVAVELRIDAAGTFAYWYDC
jgi:hypothetical protein